MESNSLPKGEVESLSVSKGKTSELNEASPPTKWNTNDKFP